MRIFEELPDDLDETWTNGVLVGGMASAPNDFEIARAYRAAAKALIGPAIASLEAWNLTYPILFLYRHALELYLKAIVRPAKLDHKLGPLLDKFEVMVRERYKQEIPDNVREDLRVFADLDAVGLRYSHDLKSRWSGLPGEYWVSLTNLETKLDAIGDTLERVYLELERTTPV